MPIIRVPVTITNSYLPDPAMNVWHVRTVSSPADGDDLTQALNSIEQFYEDIIQVYPNGTAIRLGEGMIQDPLGEPTYVSDDGREVTKGGSLDHPLPLYAALVISWRTSSASRSGRGRTFIGPLRTESLQTDATPANEVVSLLKSAAKGHVARSGGVNGWATGVLSVKQGLLRDHLDADVKDRFAYLSSRRD